MDRFGGISSASDKHLKFFSSWQMPPATDSERDQSRQFREPQISTLPTNNGRFKALRPTDFGISNSPHRSQLNDGDNSEVHWQIDRKRDNSRNFVPMSSFKKALIVKVSANGQPSQTEAYGIPKLKLPSSDCLEPNSATPFGSYKRHMYTDRSPAYNSREVPQTPSRDHKLLRTTQRSKSPERGNRFRPIESKFGEAKQYRGLAPQDLKETLSTLSTNVYAPIQRAATLNASYGRPQKLKPEDFEFIRQLGKGKSSTVFMVRHIKTGFLASLKCIKKEQVLCENMREQLTREVKIGSFSRHPNIVALYSFFDSADSVYLLSELGCDGQLYKKLKRAGRFSEEATAFIVRQVLEAVAYLHQNCIYHRDIKPENIVLSHGIVKLCDFGWSVNAQGKELRETVCGTPLYASPEILQGRRYDEKIDLWAVGILAYELFFGSIPFDIKLERDLIRIITDDIKFPVSQQVSSEFKDFIQSVLQKNPSYRLSAEELLKHPYIAKYRGFETCEEICFA